MQIRDHVDADPDKPAIILHPSGTVVTFGELEARANRVAHYFRKAGLKEGDVVAILMENNEHIHAVMWAARRSGLVLRADQHPPDRGRGRLHHRQQRREGDHRIGGAAQGLREPRRASTRRTARLLMIADDDLDGWLRYPECVADQPDTPIDDEIEGDLLQYSSGTTGRPKGIKRELPHVPPAEAPGMMSALVGFWMDPDAST